MKSPPIWTEDQFGLERATAEEHFREGRHTEPLEVYLELFDSYHGVVEEVMEETVDLTKLDDSALAILSDDRKREVFRYLTGPPVSEDDLKVSTLQSREGVIYIIPLLYGGLLGVFLFCLGKFPFCHD